MSFAGGFDDAGWSAPIAGSGDLVSQAIKKEKVLKWVHTRVVSNTTTDDVYRREIAASQEDLKGLSNSGIAQLPTPDV